MDQMIELKYIPCFTIRTLQRYMNIDLKGVLIEDAPWNTDGAPSLMTSDNIEEIVIMCGTTDSGMTYCRSSIKAYIVSKKKVKLKAVGLAAFGLKDKINNKTVRNYMAIIACHPKMHVVSSSLPRTKERIMASNSIGASVSLLVVIAIACVFCWTNQISRSRRNSRRSS